MYVIYTFQDDLLLPVNNEEERKQKENYYEACEKLRHTIEGIYGILVGQHFFSRYDLDYLMGLYSRSILRLVITLDEQLHLTFYCRNLVLCETSICCLQIFFGSIFIWKCLLKNLFHLGIIGLIVLLHR